MSEIKNSIVNSNGLQSVRQKTVGEQILSVSQLVLDILFLLIQVVYYVGLSIYQAIVPVSEKSVKGEIVLITGIGHGIGKELALLYASLGATVVGWDINAKGNEATIKEIANRKYTKAYSYVVDVSSREEVLNAAKKVQAEVGEVTILVNNAGIMPTRPFLEQNTAEIERQVNINLMAHFWTLQAFLPTMVKNNNGHIVALSSCAGLLGFKNLVPYCATKFAVRGLMQALYEEIKEIPNNRIKLTSIMPYMVDTGLCKKPVIRFDKLMPMQNPTFVAQQIVHAQRTDLTEITVPRFIYNINNVARILPVKACLKVKDFFGAGVDPDL